MKDGEKESHMVDLYFHTTEDEDDILAEEEDETREPYLSAKSVARTLDVPLPTVRFWTRIGMPCHRFGRLTRYRLSTVVAWLEERGDKRLESIRQKLGTKQRSEGRTH